MGRLATYTTDDAPALPTEGTKFQPKRRKSVKLWQTGKRDVSQHISAQTSIKCHFFPKEFHTEVTSNLQEFSFVSSWSKMTKKRVHFNYLPYSMDNHILTY